MSKPLISNITTTQTFQNWFDKTNEMVNLFRDQVVTASVTGDTTTGNATLIGDFKATEITADDILFSDSIEAKTNGGTIEFNSPIQITGATSNIVATFNFAATGGRTRYTNGSIGWDIGLENSTDGRFIMTSGTGGQFALSTQGVLTVPSIVVDDDIVVTGTITGDVSANNVVANNITAVSGFVGNLTGDIYHPNPAGGNGTGKVLENGGPAANIPATFFGNVNGTVSSLTNHKTDNLAEGTTNLYFTTARARNAFSAGTGVSISGGVISIGQAVSNNSNVTFKSIFVNGGAGTEALGTIIATGDITAFGTISDVTMKENITPIDNALEKVSKLGGYFFNYKGDDSRMTGVMAQELMDVLPGVVYETVDPKTQQTVYAVRHGNIIGLLIEAIKELKEQVGK